MCVVRWPPSPCPARSIRVLPGLQSLGNWLQQHQLPLFKGSKRGNNSSRTRNAPATAGGGVGNSDGGGAAATAVRQAGPEGPEASRGALRSGRGGGGSGGGQGAQADVPRNGAGALPNGPGTQAPLTGREPVHVPFARSRQGEAYGRQAQVQQGMQEAMEGVHRRGVGEPEGPWTGPGARTMWRGGDVLDVGGLAAAADVPPTTAARMAAAGAFRRTEGEELFAAAPLLATSRRGGGPAGAAGLVPAPFGSPAGLLPSGQVYEGSPLEQEQLLLQLRGRPQREGAERLLLPLQEQQPQQHAQASEHLELQPLLQQYAEGPPGMSRAEAEARALCRLREALMREQEGACERQQLSSRQEQQVPCRQLHDGHVTLPLQARGQQPGPSLRVQQQLQLLLLVQDAAREGCALGEHTDRVRTALSDTAPAAGRPGGAQIGCRDGTRPAPVLPMPRGRWPEDCAAPGGTASTLDVNHLTRTEWDAPAANGQPSFTGGARDGGMERSWRHGRGCVAEPVMVGGRLGEGAGGGRSRAGDDEGLGTEPAGRGIRVVLNKEVQEKLIAFLRREAQQTNNQQGQGQQQQLAGRKRPIAMPAGEDEAALVRRPRLDIGQELLGGAAGREGAGGGHVRTLPGGRWAGSGY